ncbi:hypothetical protein H310_03446 [Aphanomyces invadans]|uniref:Lysosomal Pro-X carboxypeptidase n=1 Tax=Aphanomyces invadans TaxID=157072 RepID=A0A024UIS1_9STRA|nr:hypothetical protein H310_03446 [Aphanomyces invadans]ETW05762.1 hypothetical protein H310_03446 [Aphanomyces invadans]|eukprot:XP_008865539.1 hypothetical protein H310_03446 [Aphanomyces invadans]
MEGVPLLTSTQSTVAPPARSFKALLGVAFVFAGIFVCSVVTVNQHTTHGPSPPSSNATAFSGDLRKRCSELYMTQTLNHFEAIPDTYSQRYFVCSEFWHGDGAPIFFYVGNEADVELYLNHTGLMWENAAEFGALLVFAEHRFFGKSVPYGADASKHLQHLSSEQALADYAVLLREIKAARNVTKSAVIGFGGSYGGMLGTWFRIKYPHVIDGVIAGSAPVLSFLGDTPPANLTAYSQIVTFDASAAGGSVPNCVANVRRSWDVLFESAKTAEGRKFMGDALGLCEPLATEEDALSIPGWMKSAYEYLAMGNYPYPSSYIMNGVSELPAYPVRAACLPLEPLFPATKEGNRSLLHAMRASIGVYYNSTFDTPCYSTSSPSAESQVDANYWDYLFCSELYQPQDQGVNDMFWLDLHNDTAMAEECLAQWNVTLRPLWATTVYGGHKALKDTSNIVFSNGNYDPWSGMGVLEDMSESVVAVKVDGGAHHLDLMFSHPLDSPGVKAAREVEKAHIRKWIQQVHDARGKN